MLEQGTSSARDLEQWARRLWRGWRVRRGGWDGEGGVRVQSGDEKGGEWEPYLRVGIGRVPGLRILHPCTFIQR